LSRVYKKSRPQYNCGRCGSATAAGTGKIGKGNLPAVQLLEEQDDATAAGT